MKAVVQLRQKSNDQLKNRIIEINISLRRVRAKGAASRAELFKGGQKGENTRFIRNLRREQARILTILTEREKKVS